MWWKNYIGSPVGISSLPRNKLEELLTASHDQLQKMQNQEAALKSEINDITIETNRQFSSSRDFTGTMDPTGDEISPSNYTASERRVHQLRATISQMMADKEQLDQEISEKEDILNRFASMYSVEQTVAKESLLVGPFNNTELRKIFTYITKLAEKTTDKEEKDELHFCLDILSGESKLLARRLEQLHSSFNKACLKQEDDLEEMILDAQKTTKAIEKLREQIETVLKNSDTIQPVLPSTKKDLLLDIKTLGNTSVQLKSITDEVDQLKKQKKQLKNECNQLGAELLLQPYESGTSSDARAVAIREKKLQLELEQHTIEERQTTIESSIESMKEEIGECEAQILQINNQCSALRKVMSQHKQKYD